MLPFDYKLLKVLRYVYAVEDDFIEPYHIRHTLETRLIPKGQVQEKLSN